MKNQEKFKNQYYKVQELLITSKLINKKIKEFGIFVKILLIFKAKIKLILKMLQRRLIKIYKKEDNKKKRPNRNNPTGKLINLKMKMINLRKN